jgi:hypothetical protein
VGLFPLTSFQYSKAVFETTVSFSLPISTEPFEPVSPMAEAFGIGAGIVGVVGLTIQITRVLVQFGLDWKDAPADVKSFMAELRTLKVALSEIHTSIIVSRDFAEAFEGRTSMLLSQLGTGAPLATDTKLMLASCKSQLENLLSELEKRAKGHRVGWERLKGAFLAKGTREAIETLHRQCQTLNSIISIDATVLGATTFKEVREARKEQQEWHQAEVGQKILMWLKATDYSDQQSDFFGQRQEGTGQWLLDSGEYQRWSSGNRQTLFCQGMPGAGKTMMASIAIDHLYTKYRNDVNIGIAYLYCNFRRQYEQRPADLLASLLKQLAQRRPVTPESMKSLYERHKRKQTRPSFGEISKVLQYIVADYQKVFIIIDALDECQVTDGGRAKFLSEIFNLQANTGANLFATSRFVPEIERQFEGSIPLEIRASDEDVQRYIDGHMSQLRPFVLRDPALLNEIKTEIVKAVDGMFLLAKLHLDSLINKFTATTIRLVLKKLPKVDKTLDINTNDSSWASESEAYDYAYSEAMVRIKSQGTDCQRFAMRVLSWITCTKRHLTTLELRHALAVKVGESELDKDNLPETEDIVSICAGLVNVNEKSDIIRLVHYTTQEYFERTQKNWFPDAETDIAETCVTYLSFDVFAAGSCPTDDEFEARLKSYALYDYAARNWGHHACAAWTEAEQLILNLVKSNAKVSASSQAMMASRRYLDESGYSQRVPREMTGVHLAAYFGLREAMIILPKKGHHPDLKDTYGRTPLSWAADGGHDAVVKLLLANDGVDPDSKDTKYGRTPLSWAAEGGHDAVVKLLLANDGVDLDSKDTKYGRTPLCLAAANGHEAVVRLLLEKKVDINTKSVNGMTSLHWVAKKGHEAVVALLLEYGADIEMEEIDGGTPLAMAIEAESEAVSSYCSRGVPRRIIDIRPL